MNRLSRFVCLFVRLFLIMFYIFSLLRISNSNGGEYICESEGLASKQFMNRGFLQTTTTMFGKQVAALIYKKLVRSVVN